MPKFSLTILKDKVTVVSYNPVAQKTQTASIEAGTEIGR